MLAPRRNWLVTDVAFITRAEVRNVWKKLVYIRIGNRSGHENWTVRARDEEGRDKVMSTSTGKSPFWG
jgi:hypothetical protein